MAKIKAATDQIRRALTMHLTRLDNECASTKEVLDSFQKDSERVEMYLTRLDDECSRMREEIVSFNEEVNG